jgi:hypothetical protein
MKIKNCPCKDCICIPMCKWKKYKSLIEECNILAESLYYEGVLLERNPEFNQLIYKTVKYLKPVMWGITETDLIKGIDKRKRISIINQSLFFLNNGNNHENQ